jgi:hypothetical protein
MTIQKLVAGTSVADPSASTGAQVATAVNGLIDGYISSKQQFLDAIASGGTFLVKSGNYDFSSDAVQLIANDLSLNCEDGSVIVSGNRPAFRPTSGSLSIIGATFTQLGNGLNNSIINLDAVSVDGVSIYLDRCKSTSVQYVVFAADEKPHNFTVKSITVKNCEFSESIQAAYKVAGIKCARQFIENCTIDGGDRAGIQAGYVEDDGSGVQASEIESITISGNFIKNIKPVTVGGGGSNAIRAEGFGVNVIGNVIEDCFSLVGTGPINVEAIYSKMVSGIISGNSVKNNTANQGAIVVKGGGRAATTTAAAGHKIFVTNNTVFNTLKTGEFANSVGIYIQASDVFLDNNHIENMNSRAINTGGVSADLLSNISISNTMIHNPSASILIDFVAWIEDVNVSNVYVNGIDRATDAQVIRISPPSGKTINRVRVSNAQVFGVATGAGRYNLFQVASAQNTTDLNASNCGGSLLKRLIRKDDAGVLDKFTVTNCDLQTPANVVEVFGGTITNAWTKDNRGWMERTGTFNLGTVAANTKTSVYIGSIEDAAAGDFAQFALNLPATIRCEARAAGSGINFLLENTSGASVDISATTGVAWTEKRYSALT